MTGSSNRWRICMSAPTPYAPDLTEPVPGFLKKVGQAMQNGVSGEIDLNGEVDKVREQNPEAFESLKRAVNGGPTQLTDEHYVANNLDRLNHRKMKNLAAEMLKGREEKPMT